MKKNIDEMIILSLETSCDETSCAIVKGREVFSNVISSQIDIHKRFGGVVPEIASRNHTLAVKNVVQEALNEAKMSFKDIDAIAVTYGAGLLGALLIGVSYAKSLAYVLDVPLIPVNHLAGHISANFIANKDLKPPFLCLLVSGGHTAIIEVKDYCVYNIIGTTLDDAVGEAFDKVARLLNLKYPGGPQIQKLAKEGKPSIEFPKPFKNQKHFNFSYSGLKTAVMNFIHNSKQKGLEINKADIACSFQKGAIDMLVDKTILACKQYGYKKLAIAGGVGANIYLRESMDSKCKKLGINVTYPPLKLCTDNAGMIGCAAYYMVKCGNAFANLDLDANSSLKLKDL